MSPSKCAARELLGAEYPPRLRDLENPPRVYLNGELPRGQSVAIVGTRACSDEGRAFAFSLARSLAEEGVLVMSGGAEGIDTEAHRGALAAGQRTVVVGPSSFDAPFPEENTRLFQRVVDEGGAYLSRNLTKPEVVRNEFRSRNGVLVAMVDAVIVVETRVIGGARNATAWARKLHRPVMIVPGAPWGPMGAGPTVELQLGGKAIASYKDVLKVLGRLVEVQAPRPASSFIEGAQVPGSNKDHPDAEALDAVRNALRHSPCDLDDLHSRTGLPVGRLRGLILTLAFDGVLVSSPDGQLSLVNQ